MENKAKAKDNDMTSFQTILKDLNSIFVNPVTKETLNRAKEIAARITNLDERDYKDLMSASLNHKEMRDYRGRIISPGMLISFKSFTEAEESLDQIFVWEIPECVRDPIDDENNAALAPLIFSALSVSIRNHHSYEIIKSTLIKNKDELQKEVHSKIKNLEKILQEYEKVKLSYEPKTASNNIMKTTNIFKNIEDHLYEIETLITSNIASAFEKNRYKEMNFNIRNAFRKYQESEENRLQKVCLTQTEDSPEFIHSAEKLVSIFRNIDNFTRLIRETIDNLNILLKHPGIIEKYLSGDRWFIEPTGKEDEKEALEEHVKNHTIYQ